MKQLDKFSRSLYLIPILVGLCSAQIPERHKWNQRDILKDRFDLVGVVTDQDSKPILNVTVTAFEHFKTGGYAPVKAKTDQNGKFILQRVGHVAYFQKKGFRPEIRVLPETEHSVAVKLLPFKADSTVLQCTESQKSKFRDGMGLAIDAPNNINSVHHSGDDTWDDVFFHPQHPKESLLLWSGPLIGGNNLIPEDLLRDAREFNQKVLVNEGGNEIGFDIRGISKDRKRWRYMGLQYDLLRYQGVSNEAAAYLDPIVDSACLVGD
jgi:hypothetical protein